MQSYLFKYMETKATNKSNGGELERSSFSDDFIFGSASAAFQYEGAARQGGRGPSIWDDWVRRFPDKIADGSNADRAVDFYNQYKEDVKTMKKFGFDAFRLSISWSRILPTGRLNGGVNREGVKFYNDLIDELLANGITPFVTLYHFDLPQVLEDQYGGFLSSEVVSDFRDYADICFWEFGDRVKHWITLNEPWTYTIYGYVSGEIPPGRGAITQTSLERSGTDATLFNRFLNTTRTRRLPVEQGNPGTEPYIVTHNSLLAHAGAVELYKKKYQEAQKGKIGITLVTDWCEPYSNSQADCDAALRKLDFVLGWYMDPLVNGDYPTTMKNNVGNRLPRFSEEDSKKVKGSYDFIGLNYYFGTYVQDSPNSGTEVPSYETDSEVKTTSERDGIPIGTLIGDTGLCSYPKGLYNYMMYVKNKYNDPLVYITENGVTQSDDVSLTVGEQLNDTVRKDFFIDHLSYLLAAKEDGANIKGYFAWSLMDNFEWISGYTSRYGLIHIDYKDPCLARYARESAKWFMSFLKKGVKINPLKRARIEYEEDSASIPETNKKLALLGTAKGT